MARLAPKRKYPSIYPPSLGKRITAYLIDFILILILGFFSFIAIDAIYTSSASGKLANDNLNTVRYNSGLYLKVDGELIYLTSDINVANNKAIYLNRLEYFYLNPNSGFDYLVSSYYDDDKPFDYYSMVLKRGDETSLFSFIEEDSIITYDFKDNLSNEDKNDGWNNVYTIALSDLQATTASKNAEQVIKRFVALNLTLSAFVGTIVPGLLIPLYVGHGRGLGKFVTGLAVVNKDGYKVGSGAVIIRFLVFGIFETALNIYGYFVPLLLTSGALTLTHNNRALHDLISKTYVIDAKKSRIFNNAEDEEKFFLSSDQERKANTSFFTEAPLTNSLPLK